MTGDISTDLYGDWFLDLERADVLERELKSEGLPKDLRTMDPESILVGTGQEMNPIPELTMRVWVMNESEYRELGERRWVVRWWVNETSDPEPELDRLTEHEREYKNRPAARRAALRYAAQSYVGAAMVVEQCVEEDAGWVEWVDGASEEVLSMPSRNRA